MTNKRNIGESAKNIVLVHGGFVDGSGWQGVYDDGRHGQRPPAKQWAQ